jgi:large subunit ribosomal protein L21
VNEARSDGKRGDGFHAKFALIDFLACECGDPRHSARPAKSITIMAYAVIQTGGKQYRVESGSEIDVEKLDAEVGTDITLSEVLLVSNGSKIQIGTPFVNGAKVGAKVVEQYKDDKVIAFKFRRRKGYHRTVGHRRQLTRLKIESIPTK